MLVSLWCARPRICLRTHLKEVKLPVLLRTRCPYLSGYFLPDLLGMTRVDTYCATWISYTYLTPIARDDENSRKIGNRQSVRAICVWVPVVVKHTKSWKKFHRIGFLRCDSYCETNRSLLTWRVWPCLTFFLIITRRLYQPFYAFSSVKYFISFADAFTRLVYTSILPSHSHYHSFLLPLTTSKINRPTTCSASYIMLPTGSTTKSATKSPTESTRQHSPQSYL